LLLKYDCYLTNEIHYGFFFSKKNNGFANIDNNAFCKIISFSEQVGQLFSGIDSKSNPSRDFSVLLTYIPGRVMNDG